MIKSRVKTLLSQDKNLCDRDLYIRYLQNFHCKNKKERYLVYKILSEAPSFRYIVDNRIKIQKEETSLQDTNYLLHKKNINKVCLNAKKQHKTIVDVNMWKFNIKIINKWSQY